MRLTLRTLLAYLDDTLPPDQARVIGQKVAESETAQELVEKIKKVTRRRGLSTPTAADGGNKSDPNTVAEYLNDQLSDEQIAPFEKLCLESDVHLAEVAACHQLLTLLLAEPVRVPPTARQRMYGLVKGRESLPNRKPGKTVPIAGEMPTENEAAGTDAADAAYLLGLPAYSRSGPAGRRGVSLAVAGALFVGLIAAVWMAVPARNRSAVPTREPDVVGFVPAPAPAAKDPPVVEKKPPVEPMPPSEPMPAAVPPPANETPTAVAPAVQAADPVGPPRQDRATVGKLTTPERVVVTGRPGNWVRVTADMPDVSSVEKTVCLPGHRAKVRLASGSDVELWGNLPELSPVPVAETAVTFYPPADGFDADFELHAGRVYLTTPKPTGGKVRVRTRDQVWDVSLTGPTTDVVLEVVNSLARGIGNREAVPQADLRQVSVGIATLRGTGSIRRNAGDEKKLNANDGLNWSSETGRVDGPRPLGNGLPFVDSAYFSRFLPSSAGAEAKAANQAVADVARRASGRDGVLNALREAFSEAEQLTQGRATAMKAALYGQAALGETAAVIDALADPARPFLREAAAFALSASFAARPDDIDMFRTRLKERHAMDDDQTDFAVHLLRGATEAERKDAAVLDKLADGLSAQAGITRELCFWTLKTDIDPTARNNRSLYTMDTAAPASARDPFVKAWKKRIDEIKRQ